MLTLATRSWFPVVVVSEFVGSYDLSSSGGSYGFFTVSSDRSLFLTLFSFFDKDLDIIRALLSLLTAFYLRL